MMCSIRGKQAINADQESEETKYTTFQQETFIFPHFQKSLSADIQLNNSRRGLGLGGGASSSAHWWSSCVGPGATFYRVESSIGTFVRHSSSATVDSSFRQFTTDNASNQVGEKTFARPQKDHVAYTGNRKMRKNVKPAKV